MRDFLPIVLLVTVSLAKQGNSARRLSMEGQEALERCKEQEGATDDDLHLLQQKAIPTTTSGKCFLACMMEKSHLMKDGKYDDDQAVHMAQRTLNKRQKLLKKAKNKIKNCSEQSQDITDRCDHAAAFAQCMNPSKT